MVMFFNSLLRQIVGIIDGLLYGLGAELYGLMMDIASAKVFSNDTIQNVSMRVYQLLGLVMLFRLIFAFLTYVINPEDMTDKNKGYTKIVKKIFTSLALVIITPWLFTQSRNLQIYIINDHLIEYFIFGTTGSSDARPGYTLMYTVAKTFYVPYSCADAICKEKQDTKSALCTGVAWDENLPKFTEQAGKHILDTSSSAFGKCGYGADDQDYANRLWNATHPDNDGKYQLSTLTGLARDYSGDNFKINFQWPFVGSTLVGGFICYVLLIMCMDIALRSVKLSFYEMIAPVPILSNLGFKDGKDSMLNKWFHEVLKTYADLFTRVAGLQISIFAIQELVNNGLAKNDNNIFVTLFLIIGALMFAKKLPDILKGMGINFEGGGSFNIKKKLMDETYAKQLISGGRRVAGVTTGLIGGAFAGAGSNIAARFRQQRNEGHGLVASIGRSALSGVGGFFTGGARGVTKGVTSKSPGQALHAATQGSRYIKAGSSFMGRSISSMQKASGAQTRADRFEETFKNRDALKGKMDTLETELGKEATKKNFTMTGMTVNGITLGGERYADLESRIATAKARGSRSISVVDSSGASRQLDAYQFDGFLKDMREKTFDRMTSTTGPKFYDNSTGADYVLDQQIDYMLTDMERDIKRSDKEVKNGFGASGAGTKSYKEQKDAVKRGQAATTRDKAESGSFSYDRAKSNAQFAGKNDKK